MWGIITVFGSIAIVCGSGIAASSALKWFHSYELDIDKINKKKSANTERGGVLHEKHMENLSRRINNK